MIYNKTLSKAQSLFKALIRWLPEGVRWSILATLGNLSVMKMVILVPFIGTMIIFNEQFVNLLTVSTYFLQNIGVSVDGESPQALTIDNLYYLYFGLLCLGVGSLLFSIFCPKEIQFSSSEDEYVRNFDSQNSQVTTQSNFRLLLYLEHKTTKAHGRSDKFDQLFHDIILAIYLKFDSENPDYLDGSFINGAGYPDLEAVISAVRNDAKAVWAFSKPFQSMSVYFSGDILRCLYNILDLTFFHIRVSIAVFYLSGLTLLFVPTAKTIYKIIASTLF